MYTQLDISFRHSSHLQRLDSLKLRHLQSTQIFQTLEVLFNIRPKNLAEVGLKGLQSEKQWHGFKQKDIHAQTYKLR